MAVRTSEEAGRRSFDGIICMGGGDWWYHNRGHFAFQMMTRLKRIVPVIYVNSMGVRVPSPREGSMFLRRVLRKFKSWTRGFQVVDDGFAVVSPVNVPGRLGTAICLPALAAQIRHSARRMNMSQPLLWVECPPGVKLVDRISAVGVLHQRTDRYEEFPGADQALVLDYVRQLREVADVTLYCSSYLLEQEREVCDSGRFLDHGVDYDRFESAGRGEVEEPEDLRALPRPRVGFIGGIDGHTFDAELFRHVAGALSDVCFVLVGACSFPEGWCALPNVHLLGQRPYEEVAGYMAACDVLIMPWNDNRWIEACNPVKLKEYLAVGRPVVSTPYPELDNYKGVVRIAPSRAGFVAAIRGSLESSCEPQRLRDRVRGETWDARAETALAYLAAAGLDAKPRAS